MNIELFDSNSKKLKLTVRPYKNGFRASLRLEYKDGTTERIQKYSAESPEKAQEKVYLAANEKYYKNLNRVEDEIVFSPITNKELLKIERDIPDKVIAEAKNNLLFSSVSQNWLEMILKKTFKDKTNRNINLNTFEYYRSIVHTYLNRDFGMYKVNELTLEIVQKKFDERVDLVYKTLKGNRSALAQVLEFAKDKGYIQENFAHKIELPSERKVVIDFYNEKQSEKFRECCAMDGRAIAILYMTNLGLGLRPEERLWFEMEQDSLFNN